MDKCPHCGTELEVGFGLAGGGYGAYTYCPSDECGKYFDKTQELDDQTPQESGSDTPAVCEGKND